ncbi:MAG: alkane 1-monooxygenase [Bacteroidota bacterium]|nr:alkane 1-monooxygenase [Bacteroidota bacterium]MDX5429681.1 alkane 1-monooxygenase [Bacteroidota bacterium]MDX5468459.1 alkane 1-monooxygenase [Bacteroidota bacterium]
MQFWLHSIRYLLAFIPALAVWTSFIGEELWSFSGIALIFIVLPLLEYQLGTSQSLSAETPEEAKKFDWVILSTLPVYIGMMGYFFHDVSTSVMSDTTLIGRTLSAGLLCGVYAINVSHELGHRNNKLHQVLAQILLASSFYSHFFIEHNRGHHKHVATPEDPSSGRINEPVYLFWLRSMSQTWLTAWKIENQRLKKEGLPAFHWKNLMLRLQILQWLLLANTFFWFGPLAGVCHLAAGIIGALLLETINYIEHYGLVRNRLPSGNYEPVKPQHSWNSDHILGRYILFELCRHSDHHYRASKPFPLLASQEEGPQMPLGYPGMMVVSLFPPLWFHWMNPKAMAINARNSIQYP